MSDGIARLGPFHHPELAAFRVQQREPDVPFRSSPRTVNCWRQQFRRLTHEAAASDGRAIRAISDEDDHAAEDKTQEDADGEPEHLLSLSLGPMLRRSGHHAQQPVRGTRCTS